eukprot:11048980-Lingulodinium_polyedra.AAC.1
MTLHTRAWPNALGRSAWRPAKGRGGGELFDGLICRGPRSKTRRDCNRTSTNNPPNHRPKK